MDFPQQIKVLGVYSLFIIASMQIRPSAYGNKQRGQEGTLPISAADKAEGQVLWQFDTGG